MEKVISRCMETFELPPDYRVIDLGSGVGIPSWYFAARGAELSMGVELVAGRAHQCYKAYREILTSEDCADLLKRSVSLKVAFGHVDILEVSSLAYFDLVYMFDCGFNPELLGHIASIIGKGRNKWLVSYYPHSKLTARGFELRLLSKINRLRLSRSNETHTAYFYQIIPHQERKRKRLQEPILDEVLMPLLQQALAPYEERVNMMNTFIDSANIII
jgi:hypothetical protein